MASRKKTFGAVLGAALLTGAVVGGINKTTPAPIPVKHGMCVKGHTTGAYTYQGKTYPKGTICVPVQKAKKAAIV